MNKKWNYIYTYYYQDGEIKRDEFGFLGYETLEELQKYIRWCVD